MKTKRFFAGALAFVMTVMSTAAFTASAANAVTVTADKVTASAGSTFKLNVSLAGVPSTGINACEFMIKYDSTVVKVTGVTAGAVATTGADAQETSVSSDVPAFGANYDTAGEISVEWATGLTSSDYFIKSDGVFLTVEGTVDSAAKAGEYPVEIVAIDRASYEGATTSNSDIVFANVSGTTVTSYDATVVNGSITVAAETAEETTVAATEAATKAATTAKAEETTAKTPAETAAVNPTANYGDVNADGDVNISDVVLLNKSLVHSATLSAQGQINADAYLDNTINSNDSLTILKSLVGSVSELPQYPA